jgi:hypothetical protein
VVGDGEPAHPLRPQPTSSRQSKASDCERERRRRMNDRPSAPMPRKANAMPVFSCWSAAVAVLVVMVSVEVAAVVPLAVSDAGLKVQVVRAGSPLHESTTVAENPPAGASETVLVAELPLPLMVALADDSETLKSGGMGVMITVVPAEVDEAYVLSPA